jgi:uncharacterized protein (UPF0332 family)
VPQRWQTRSRVSLAAAQVLFLAENWHGCANRAYYAAYQAATAAAIAHGDAGQFPAGWNNPTHEQLPVLIGNNGDLPQAIRRQLRRDLQFLRAAREDADYRVGHTVDREVALRCFHSAANVHYLLNVPEGDENE